MRCVHDALSAHEIVLSLRERPYQEDGTGNPLNFAAGRFLDIQGGIVASSTPELHAQLLAAIASKPDQ